MGNKPEMTTAAESLTWSLARHSRVAYYPSPIDAPCLVLISFVLDQLLIGRAVLEHPDPRVLTELNAWAHPTGSTVFGQLSGLAEDVEIWSLNDVSGSHEDADVAEFVWSYRNDILGPRGIPPEQVAPNHILVPAPNYHECPWGPPGPADALQLPTMRALSVNVGVLDSGWEAAGPAKDLVAAAEYGGWLDTTSYSWETSTAASKTTKLPHHTKERLRALTGHANFVAGLIAMACPEASIKVVSHNSAFLEADDGDPAIATEASVARSIWKLATDKAWRAELINVGFAFPTLPSIKLTSADYATPGPPSWALQVVLDSLAGQGKAPFIVAPAGNQGCLIRQYPAAFAGLKYPNVIGVGSVDTDGATPSDFSNHGDWVTCCAVGRDVVSTFIGAYTGETEDPDDPENPKSGHSNKRFSTGFARWSGTSFAAPKVTGALAAARAAGKTLPTAWTDLQKTGTGKVLPL